MMRDVIRSHLLQADFYELDQQQVVILAVAVAIGVLVVAGVELVSCMIS